VWQQRKLMQSRLMAEGRKHIKAWNSYRWSGLSGFTGVAMRRIGIQ
jgi:hypothetical protein